METSSYRQALTVLYFCISWEGGEGGGNHSLSHRGRREHVFFLYRNTCKTVPDFDVEGEKVGMESFFFGGGGVPSPTGRTIK